MQFHASATLLIKHQFHFYPHREHHFATECYRILSFSSLKKLLHKKSTLELRASLFEVADRLHDNSATA